MKLNLKKYFPVIGLGILGAVVAFGRRFVPGVAVPSPSGTGSISHVKIDAGHGGKDPGAPGADREVYEKTGNLEAALILQSLLVARGIKVSQSRTTDIYPSFPERRSGKHNIFVSLHHDQATARPGLWVYHNKAATGLAKMIASKMEDAFKQHVIVKLDESYLVLQDARPSVIVELGYTRNYSKSEHLERLTPVANAVLSYLKSS